MPRSNKSRLRSGLGIAAEKAALLARIKTLYDQRASRLSFEINGYRMNAAQCTDVTFDPDAALGKNAISFQRQNGDLTEGGKEETKITCVADTGHKASGTLNLAADIVLTKSTMGTVNNTRTFTLEVVAAAANPSATVLADFTGTAAAIVLTITPNDGTNNTATPVDLTTAEIVELINTGAVSGKTVTVTDGSTLRTKQTATGGDATVVVDAGEGDHVTATFTGGLNSNLNSKAFLAYTGSDAAEHSFYFNVNGEGVDPSAGGTAHAVAIAAGVAVAAVASALATAVNGVTGFDASASSPYVTMNNTVAGYATDVADVDTGFAISKLGELEQYDLSDIVMIRRLRNKKYVLVLAGSADAAHAS